MTTTRYTALGIAAMLCKATITPIIVGVIPHYTGPVCRMTETVRPAGFSLAFAFDRLFNR